MERRKKIRGPFAQRRRRHHPHARVAVLLQIFIFVFIFTLACHRASFNDRVDLSTYSLISPRSQENIRALAPSVVGIAAVFEYRIEFFQHELAGGQFVADAASPTGYRLAAGSNQVMTTKKIQKTTGGGLVIYRDMQQAVILTCEHVVISPDTIVTFYRDLSGNETKIMASRAIKRNATHHFINQVNQLEKAEILYTDARMDLGLLTVATKPSVGELFNSSIAYKAEVKWGDVAYVFGYPREIKQLSLGLVSPAPYPGAFSLDVVGRYGFSGGPVFVVRPGGALELAGVIRGVPVTKLRYLAPAPDLTSGQLLQPDDLKQIAVEEHDLIEFGTVYAIGAEKIGRFLKASQSTLEAKGIFLPAQLLPQ